MRAFTIGIVLALILPSLQEKIDFNPYEVLNVERNAATSEIRSSYKKLAKTWHPDKNKSPDAQDKFIRVQQAYEILSDENKREQYDTGGYSSEAVGQWQYHGEPFTFQHADFTFDFNFQGSTRTMSLHDYYSRVIPESYNVPHLIYVYSTFCGQCIIWLRTSWQRAATDLEALGIAVYTVDTTFTSRIASGLGVSRIPTIVGYYRERAYHFKGQISKDELKNFVNSFLPNDIITSISSDNLKKFVAGIDEDDKPRAILFSEKPSPALLFSLMSLKYRKYYRFGYVSLNNPKAGDVVKEFAINQFGPTLLVFKDNSGKPSVVLRASEMPKGAINDILSINKYVTMPRLTSQNVFDEVCSEPRGAVHSIRLCMLLVTDPSFEKFDTIVSNLKRLVEEIASKEETLHEWLTFMRVHASSQPAFTRSLLSEETTRSRLMLLWRRGHKSSSVKELDMDFLKLPFESAREKFQVCLRTALETAHLQRFHNTISLSQLVDELAPGMVLSVLRTIVSGVESMVSFFKYLGEVQSMAMLMITILFALWIVAAFSDTEESGLPKKQQMNKPSEAGVSTPPTTKKEPGTNKSSEANSNPQDANAGEIKEIIVSQSPIVEITPSVYESKVLNQSRGHMTIILLSNQEHEDFASLFENYSQAMKVYTRDPKISVAYLNVKKYTTWYTEVRRTSSAEPPEDIEKPEDMSSLHSNADFDRTDGLHDRPLESLGETNGVVLALNGHKHWYCIFVPRGVKWGAAEDGCYAEGLACWMDRVREGQMPRLYVRQWPGLYDRRCSAVDGDEV